MDEDTRWAYYQMDTYNRSIQYSSLSCVLYDLQLNKVNLADWFIDEIGALPDELNGDTLPKFMRFFDLYGDHIYSKCSVGGIIEQYIATDYDYWIKSTVEEI